MSSEHAPYAPKRILITGAAGFIASHFTTRLIKNYPNYKIVALDKLDYCSSLKNLQPCLSSPNFKFVKGDLICADLVNYLLVAEDIDTIMHFAAQTHVDNSFGNSFEFTNNNIYGTHVLLEACKVTNQIKRFIHVSTDEVYGETDLETDIGNPEASQLLPTNPYSATKAGAEMLVMAYHRSYGLPTITTRGNNVYGPNQYPEKLIPKFILLAMKGAQLPIHGNGTNVRSYLHCHDVAEAFDVILHKGVIGHVYNIGTQRERRVIDVAEDVCKLFGSNPKEAIRFVQDRPFNDQRYFLDDQKLKKLGWQETTSWEEGLKMTMEWYTKNSDWWGDVSAALSPHPYLSVMTTCSNDDALLLQSGNCKSKMEGCSVHAGVTGRPNVDWCESHKVETIRTNVIGTLNLADVCREHSLLMMNFATGCIFEYDDKHPQGSGIGFKEEDKPNFAGSFYSKTKAMVEELLRNYDNVCTLRVRIPISSDLSNPRNFITKISRYNKVVNIPNSMTVLDELLPISIEMAKRKCRGIWNFTNPGVVSHNEILEMYQKYIDPKFKWENFSLEEQAKVIVAARSNNELDAGKLKKEFPELLSIKDSIIKYVFIPNKKT
ncbi:NAD-dependent epimerase/dehydratase [Corchorus capsularis]|uniref:NAD-dependent epimerase/dehydratase n=1 Tax=Corchorus capsularis TaxID=210143 RepID=A0A1R3IU85_COCAP|nr:NAD-dependent epimerase/dehydratase [Corchorus capsularis]